MVGAACIPVRDRCDAEVCQRSNPLAEDGSHCEVLLRVDAPHLAGPVVEIVVSVQSLPFLGGLNGRLSRRRLPEASGCCTANRERRALRAAEVVMNISAGAAETLLFP